MGVYLNPGKSIFNDCVLSEIYVDKSGLLQHLNRWVSRDGGFVCLTRPRRLDQSPRMFFLLLPAHSRVQAES